MRLLLASIGVLFLSVVAAATRQPTPPARFDFEVREDFFAGFAGNAERLARAMKRCDEALAQNPNHPEALVWHGSGLFFQAGTAFRSGDTANGMALWNKSLSEMARAVELAPDSPGVRIPRGAVLLEGSRYLPDRAQIEQLVRIAVGDYEHTLQIQQPYFARLSDHAKGELLFGLADGWARLGDQEKAGTYFKRLTSDAASSGRVSYANAWLSGAPPASPGRCTGCH